MLAILPALMLFAAGCATSSRPTAGVTQTSLGNAYRVRLPAGTTITLPDDSAAAQVRAVAVNETTALGARGVSLTTPLQLVSPAYITERNETEKRYALRVAALEEQLTALRAANSKSQ